MFTIKLAILLPKKLPCVKMTRFVCQYTTLAKSGLAKLKDFKILKRRYSDVRIPERYRKRLPFEQTSENIPNNTLLFSCYDAKRTAVFVSVGGTFLTLVLLQSADLTYRYSGAVKIKPPDNAPWYMWWTKINYSSELLKYTIVSIMLVSATLVFGFSMVYPSRMVREISILRGGKVINLQTHGPFGRPISKQLPVSNISAQWGQEKAITTLPLKVKGKRLMFQIYTQEGKIHNPALFDEIVCRYRF